MKNCDTRAIGCLAVIAAVIFAVIVYALVWFPAQMESRTYNRLTGAETTTWDALWVELRVQDSPKEGLK